MSDEERLIHRAEEIGQARPLTAQEVLAYGLKALLESVGLGLAAGVVIAGVRVVILSKPTSTGDVALTVVTVFALALGLNLTQAMGGLPNSLRQWRTVETYTPGVPKPPEPEPHPPILVRAAGQESTMLPDGPTLALPDGRRERLDATPENVAVILREIVERHGGDWSRSRLMGIRVNGRRVSRRLYEELTATLARAGVLKRKPQGGYRLPDDVVEYNDLRCYFAGLPGLENGSTCSGTAGGTAGGRERGPDLPPTGQGRGLTLAERRRRQWLESEEKPCES